MDLKQVSSFLASNRGFRIFEATVESTFVLMGSGLRYLVTYAFRRRFTKYYLFIYLIRLLLRQKAATYATYTTQKNYKCT